MRAFSPPGKRREEIDLVIMVPILCFLSKLNVFYGPMIRFNLRDTERPLKRRWQNKRKREAVARHYTDFANRLAQLGYAPSASPNIVCCVLTNSAIFAGFPIERVPIIDLNILGDFFKMTRGWDIGMATGGKF